MEKEKRQKGIGFEGKVKPGEVRNPYGRQGKPSLDYKKAKEGLLQVFIKSNASGTIYDMLNMKLPAILKPEGREKLSVEEDSRMRMLILTNFKWAVEQFLKILPKEIGVFGKVSHEHTLVGMVKSAETSPKSPRVIEMTKMNEKDLLDYETELDTVDSYAAEQDN